MQGHLSEKEPWEMTQADRRKIEYPIKVPNEDTVYIFRKTSKGEVDHILSGGRSGTFWASKDDYPGDYIIVAKSRKRNISWAWVIEHMEEFARTLPSEAGGLKTVWEKNPDFKERASIYNNHFQEVGEGRTLKEIVAILDKDNNITYINAEMEKKGHLKT